MWTPTFTKQKHRIIVCGLILRLSVTLMSDVRFVRCSHCVVGVSFLVFFCENIGADGWTGQISGHRAFFYWGAPGDNQNQFKVRNCRFHRSLPQDLRTASQPQIHEVDVLCREAVGSMDPVNAGLWVDRFRLAFLEVKNYKPFGAVLRKVLVDVRQPQHAMISF